MSRATASGAVVRITGIAKKTVGRFAAELGEACEKFADKVMINLPCTEIQCDEIWAFVGAKQKNASTLERSEWGALGYFEFSHENT